MIGEKRQNTPYEIIHNFYGRKWKINVREKPKGQSRIDNPKTRAVLDAQLSQDTGRRKTCTDINILSLI